MPSQRVGCSVVCGPWPWDGRRPVAWPAGEVSAAWWSGGLSSQGLILLLVCVGRQVWGWGRATGARPSSFCAGLLACAAGRRRLLHPLTRNRGRAPLGVPQVGVIPSESWCVMYSHRAREGQSPLSKDSWPRTTVVLSDSRHPRLWHTAQQPLLGPSFTALACLGLPGRATQRQSRCHLHN